MARKLGVLVGLILMAGAVCLVQMQGGIAPIAIVIGGVGLLSLIFGLKQT